MNGENKNNIVRIKILGIGGGGTNAVERMINANVPLVEYITINTDDGGYFNSHAETKVQIGCKETKGRGAGADPEKGKLSAEENASEIEEVLSECEMLFITAGMGGGTGNGSCARCGKNSAKTWNFDRCCRNEAFFI